MSIERHHTGDRMSQIVIHGDTIYLAGQVGDGKPDTPIKQQTEETLARIDSLLAEAGSDKTKILSATIWLSSIGYYDAVNEVWDKWVPLGHAPARACVEARLAGPIYDVEIGVIAAR